MTTVLAAEGLHKTYRGGHFWAPKAWEAVAGVDLSVSKGEIYALLGPNGAGKTTIVKLLVGLLAPDQGSISVLGGSPADLGVRRRMSYIPELPYFPRQLTAGEIVTFHARLFGFRGKALLERVAWALSQTGMGANANRRIGEMSKGQQERVGWAQGILNDPEFLFVDEPLSGLDPIGIIEMRELILEQRKAGRTVFFNSHILSEVQIVADRIGILVKGRMAVERVMDAELRESGLEKLFVETVRGAAKARV